ncbi:MAG: hypothetical protein HYX67_13015 [Candidatus Melainabacteria bacterium]|nr:hypothetical protein [Candidatus Melainabacteria bacterium]
MSSALLAIPPEIRSEIYSYLTKDLTGLKGLNKSCKLVHNELDAFLKTECLKCIPFLKDAKFLNPILATTISPAASWFTIHYFLEGRTENVCDKAIKGMLDARRHKAFTSHLTSMKTDVENQQKKAELEYKKATKNRTQLDKVVKDVDTKLRQHASQLATGNPYNLKNSKTDMKVAELLKNKNPQEPTVLAFRKAQVEKNQALAHEENSEKDTIFLYGVYWEIHYILQPPVEELTQKGPTRQQLLTEKVLGYIFKTLPHIEDALKAEPVLGKMVKDCKEFKTTLKNEKECMAQLVADVKSTQRPLEAFYSRQRTLRYYTAYEG